MRPFMGMTFSRNRSATSGSMALIAHIQRADIARLIERRESLELKEGKRMSTNPLPLKEIEKN